MQWIKTDALYSVKTQILANAQMRADFTACVGLYKDFISQSASSSPNSSLHISSLDTSSGNGRGRKSGNKRKRKGKRGQLERTLVPCEDRYYDKKEYGRLSPENRMWLKLQRDKRDGLDEDSEMNPLPKRQKSIQRSIAVLASAVDSLQVEVQPEKPADPRPNRSSAATVKTSNTSSNSSNSALQMIKTRQGKSSDSE